MDDVMLNSGRVAAALAAVFLGALLAVAVIIVGFLAWEIVRDIWRRVRHGDCRVCAAGLWRDGRCPNDPDGSRGHGPSPARVPAGRAGR